MAIPRIRLDQHEYNLIIRKRTEENIGIISDTHNPFVHPDALQFCVETFRDYHCTRIYHIGDFVDQHTLSKFDNELEADGPVSEHAATLESLRPWYEAFPSVKLCLGNHDARYIKAAKRSGIPQFFLKDIDDIYQMPEGWKVAMDWKVDNIYLEHGTRFSGINSHRTAATANQINTVVGHVHANAGVAYSSTKKTDKIVWGMNVGCLVDEEAYAMIYSKDSRYGVSLGCGVIVRGVPHFVPMV